MPSQAQWSKLNEYLAQVGAYDEAMPLAVNTLNQLRKLVIFDQGRIYFMDPDGRVFDEYLMGVSKKTTKAYHGYYASTDDDHYSVSKRARDAGRYLRPDNAEALLPQGQRAQFQQITVIDWSREPHDTKFYREHLAPQGIEFSTGFSLHDADGYARALFCLDRTHPVAFSRDDVIMLGIIATHVDNMFRKLYASPPVAQGDQIAMLTSDLPLTERERQVCTLLLRGTSPKGISEVFGISIRTVYKHIQNIHTKLGVSSQLELVARLSR